ncbi:hypothetical protein AGOR_G00011080 [Albula goreensis]|uniref:Fibronectin type-II domain-containing protein n=1 Tax=Albula goreensis TaxID=1534307 RepID=A0A8T3E7A5_9TELE|nr:hypothetical protein AGOR_G00011080 [Albula goreensis]
MLSVLLLALVLPVIHGQVSGTWLTKAVEDDIAPEYCVFPFKYQDRLYYSCTRVNAGKHRPWCAITSDYDTDKLWGYCLGDGGASFLMGDSPCVFPFIYGGKEYSHCITTNHYPGAPWCATTSNYDSDPDHAWAYCPTSGVRVSAIKSSK